MNKLQIIENRIFDFRKEESIAQLKRVLAHWNFKGMKIGFTNGCFDILHLGHVEYLSKAADKCDALILGLNTDSSVRKLKGETRPINDEIARAKIMASLNFIDAVIFFEENTPFELIKFINPNMLFKGNDYKIEDIVGYDIVRNNGGDIQTIELTEGYSTTKIEQKILSNVKG